MDTTNIKKIDLFYLNIIIEELNILNIDIDIDIKELIKLKEDINNISNNIFIKLKLNNINKRIIPILNNNINKLEIIREKIINNKITINKYPSYISEIININKLYLKILNKIITNNKNIELEEEILFWSDNIKYNLLVIRSDLDPIETNYIDLINKLEDKNIDINIYIDLINKLKVDNNLRSRINNKYYDLILNKINYLKELIYNEEII